MNLFLSFDSKIDDKQRSKYLNSCKSVEYTHILILLNPGTT
jgi:hypothetical protein